MPLRALIIAIEKYPNLSGLAMPSSLPGTLQAGKDFAAWIEQTEEAAGRAKPSIRFCSSPAIPGGFGATRKIILQQLLELKDEGKNTTDTLLVYFSGHGFRYAENPGNRTDIVVTSEFESLALSGECCLQLSEIVAWLRDNLGTGKHCYFVDACRNKVSTKDVQPGRLLPLSSPEGEEPSMYVMQSTPPGIPAPANGKFPRTVLNGLRGQGMAKTWDNKLGRDAMFVKYDSLAKFVGKAVQITSDVSGPVTELVLNTIKPIPQVACTIEVIGASPNEAGTLEYTRGRSDAGKSLPITKLPMTLMLEPDEYRFKVSLKSGIVVPGNGISEDIYENTTLRFKKDPGLKVGDSTDRPPSGPAKISSAIDAVVPLRSELKLRNLWTGKVRRVSSSKKISVRQGHYAAVFHDPKRGEVKTTEFHAIAGADIRLALDTWRQSAPHRAIADRLPVDLRSGGPNFSPLLQDGVLDPDLNLWLALVGGGRIVGRNSDYARLRRFPLHDHTLARKGSTGIYVLAGFEKAETRLKIGISERAVVKWKIARQPKGMAGIHEAFIPRKAGTQLVSLQIDKGLPYTLASFTMPNRCTLITVTLDEQGSLQVAQYLLPFGHLVTHLPSLIKRRIRHRNQMEDLKNIAQAIRAFRNRRSLGIDLPDSRLSQLLYAKWVDPIGSLLAAYELIRRGRRDQLGEAVGNLNHYFPEIPDSFALASLMGNVPPDRVRPQGAPLFFDGLRALPAIIDELPLPRERLDFSSVWTTWQGAVKAGPKSRVSVR